MPEATRATVPFPFPFPFVVGVGRSGTTLLRSMLDAHPSLAVVHESRFVGWMATHRSRYVADGAFSSERFLADLLDGNAAIPVRLDTWAVEPESIRSAVLGAVPRDLAEAIRAVYVTHAAAHGKPRYGDKSPGYIRSMLEIAEVLPEARFVHLVRDGRDVALAMLEVDFGGANVSHAAWLWSRQVRAAQRAGRLLGPERYLLVRYEELLHRPAAVLADICAMLDLTFEPAMIAYSEEPTQVSQGLGDQQHHENVLRPLTTGLRDWRRQMPPTEVRRFESIAGDVLEELGYDASAAGGGPDATTRLLIARGRAVAALRGRRRALGRGARWKALRSQAW